MKNLALLLLLLMPFAGIYGQTEKLTEADIQFDLPNKQWALKDKQENNNMLVLFYKRQPITDKSGRQIIPNIAFIVETVPDTTDLVVWSMQKRSLKPFEVKEVITCNSKPAKLKHKYAIGYKGNYTDKGGIEHTIYVVHLIHKGKGVQIFLDITAELFPKYESEFLKTIGSIKNISESPTDRHLTEETIDTRSKK